MGADSDLTRLSLVEASRAIAAGEISATDLAAAYLARIDAVDPAVNAYTTVTRERAVDDAARADADLAAGRYRGPLHGIPVGLKDLFNTAGIRTTSGSALFRDFVPDTDSDVAATFRAAGAVLLGKHATHEFAWGGTTNNPHFGPTRNPRDLDRIPGGSSGGSGASVVSRTSLASVGTDTCGSIRIPAAMCGCAGIKPTFGRVSAAGVRQLAGSLDHVGPIARDVRDAATVLDVLLDPTTGRTGIADAVGRSVRELRVGRLRGYFEAILDDDVATALDATADVLRAGGAIVVDIDVPDPGDLVGDIFTAVLAEAAPSLREAFAATPERFGPDVAANMRLPVPGPAEVEAAMGRARRTAAVLHEALRGCDALLSAIEPAPAPRIGDENPVVAGTPLPIEWFLTRLTSVVNVSKLPAAAVPVGLSSSGLPIGVQIIGRPYDEATAVTVAAVVERPLPEPSLEPNP